MLKCKFTNGVEVEYLSALETEEFFNGASRRTMTVTCDAGAVSLDALNAVLSDEANLTSLVMRSEEAAVREGEAEGAAVMENEQAATETRAIENVYDGYVLKLACGVNSVRVRAESPDAPAVYEDRLVFKLGKRTFIEEQLKRLGVNA